MKKIRVYSEVVYLLANVLLALAVSMLTAADWGISMIVAPAYILSEKLGFLTFGQSEYVIQALLFVVFCLLMKRVKAVYFSSFITCLFYGVVLDLWRTVVPLFNPAVTTPGSMDWPVRAVLFVVGMLLTSFAVALFFGTYLYPQVYDFFVKGISKRFARDRAKFKTIFDLSCLAVSCVMSFLLFGKLVGVGVGTLLMAIINGSLIGFFSKWQEKHLTFVPLFPRFAQKFEL